MQAHPDTRTLEPILLTLTDFFLFQLRDEIFDLPHVPLDYEVEVEPQRERGRTRGDRENSQSKRRKAN